MQQQRITLLIGALVLLSGIAYLTGVFDSAPTTISVPDLVIPVGQVNSISVMSPTFSATLTKTGGIWTITEPVSGLADTLAVGRLLDSMADLELLTVVSTNSERHERYGVAGAALTLTLDWPGGSTTFQVAAEGPDFSSSYVRLEDEREVYTAAPRISVPTALDQFRDKTLANIQAGNVIQADVAGPDYTYQLSYGVSGWSIINGGSEPVPADSTKIAAWLQRFSPLKMDGFIDKWSTGSVPVSHSIRFAEASGGTSEIFFGTAGDTLAAFAGNSNVVLRTFSTRLQTLIETPEALTQIQ